MRSLVTVLLAALCGAQGLVATTARAKARQNLTVTKAAAALPAGPARDKAVAFAAAEGAKVYESAPADPVVGTLTSQAALLLGDPKTAAARAEGAVKAASTGLRAGAMSPELLDATKTRAVARWHLGDFPGAREDAKLVLKTIPDDPVATAVAKLSEDRVRPANTRPAGPIGEATFPELALLSGPEARSPAAMANRPANLKKAVGFLAQGEKALQLGNYAEMHRLATVSLNLVPDNPKAYMQRAFANLFLHRPAGVVADATLGLALQPDSPELLGLRARGYNELGNPQAAFLDADRAITLDASHAMGWMERARARERLKEPPKAWLEDYKRAAELQPAWSNLYDEALARSKTARPAGAAPPAAAWTGKGTLVLAAGVLVVAALGLLALGLGRARGASTSPPAAAPVAAPPAPPAPAGAPAPPASAAPPSERYILGRLLGQGGMGKVYEARDTTLGRLVAVKRMREELRSSPDDLRRFLDEARTVASLAHPNIVAIHDVVEAGPMLVFELVHGRTLQEAIEAAPGRKLGPDAARKVVEQACAALDHAHERKVVHRDLKPSNIMLNDGVGVKVMDFGISRVAKDSLMRTTATVAGTPLYMAPEQEAGKAQRETDLYALAICAFEMLTGTVPFDGPAQLELKRQGRIAKAELSPRLSEFFARALDPEPQRRFHGGAELLDAFTRALS